MSGGHGATATGAAARAGGAVDDFWNEAKKKQEEEVPDPVRHIDPTPLLVIAGGTVILLLVIGGALLGVDNYLEDVRPRPTTSDIPKSPGAKKNVNLKLPGTSDTFKQVDPRVGPLSQISRATRDWLEVSGGVYPSSGWSERSERNDPPKPHLSWRVAIAQHLGSADIFNELRKDEPWDSDHNLAVAKSKTPMAFRISPDDTTGLTQFLMVVGEDTPQSQPRVHVSDVQKWPMMPLMIVQAPPSKAVFWTKPDDWQYTFLSKGSDLGLPGDSEFLGMRYDGTVGWFRKSQTRDEFRRLFELPVKPN